MLLFNTEVPVQSLLKTIIHPEWSSEGSAFRPIRKLPEEVLVQVFTLIRDQSREMPVKTLTILCCVCRQRREVIYNTPSLWSHILLFDRTIIALRRSQNASLTVEIPTFTPDSSELTGRITSRGRNTTPRDVIALLNSLLPYSNRVHGISVSLSNSIHVVVQTLQPLLPHLRSLELDGSHIYVEPLLSVEAPPNLRYLDLTSIRVPRDGGFLRGLRTLNLANLEIWPSWQEMLAGLRESPEMQDIALINTVTKRRRDIPSPEHPTTASERILLSSLRFLHLHSVHHLTNLPQVIEAPRITYLYNHDPQKPFPIPPATAESFSAILLPPDASSVAVSALRNLRREQVDVLWDWEGGRPDKCMIWLRDGTRKATYADFSVGIAVPASFFDAVAASVITRLEDLGFTIRLHESGNLTKRDNIAAVTSPAVTCFVAYAYDDKHLKAQVDYLTDRVDPHDALSGLVFPSLSSLFLQNPSNCSVPIRDSVLDDTDLRDRLTRLCEVRWKESGSKLSVKTPHNVFDVKLGKFVAIV